MVSKRATEFLGTIYDAYSPSNPSIYKVMVAGTTN
jgi:hypothetical protein